MKYALINENDVIQNMIVMDDYAAYTPPEGLLLDLVPDEAEEGDTWSEGVLTKKAFVFDFDPITPRQIRLTLLEAGLLDQVQPAIDGIEDPAIRTATQIEWEYATQYERDNMMIAAIGGALGLTDEDINALWLRAMAL